jgi:hypothetical protein
LNSSVDIMRKIYIKKNSGDFQQVFVEPVLSKQN